MFTGLVEKVGLLGSLQRTPDGARISVQCDAWMAPLVPGESVAVQGACLTVVESYAGGFGCDVLEETLRRTGLGGKRPGARLNLERALRADGRLGGHLVTGHIDGTGSVAALRNTGRDWELDVACDAALCAGIVLKGSISCDGVSLTVARVSGSMFGINIIPFTWQHTSLSALRAGDMVNLETDYIGKYVLQYMRGLSPDASAVTMQSLRNAGFSAGQDEE
jgi:riboflavin synthase